MAYRFDLHQPKGRPGSRCRIFSANRALSVAKSATTLLSRRVSSSSTTTSQCLKAGLTAGQKVVTPLRELRRRHAMAPTEALERFPLEEFDNHGDFPSRGPPPRADAAA